MTAYLLDNCGVRTATTGTGSTLALGEGIRYGRSRLQTFIEAGAVHGTRYAYKIQDGEGWEIADGAYDSSANTIGRTTYKSFDGQTVSTSPLDLSGRAEIVVVLKADDFATVADLAAALDAAVASAAAAAASAAASAASAADKVVGPASAVNNNLAAFDLTTGKLVKDSGKAIADLLLKAGGTMSGALNWAAAVTVVSATTCDIGAAASNYVNISGTTTITGLGTIAQGASRMVKFAGALILTHDGTAVILPGAANITTAANDTALFVSEGSGNWRCLVYQRASGLPLAQPAWTTIASGSLSGTAVAITSIPQTYNELLIRLSGASHNDGSSRTIDLGVSANNGSAYATNLPLTTAQAAAATLDIVVSFPRYTGDKATVFSAWGLTGASPFMSQQTAVAPITTTHTGGCNAIRLAPSAGSFDAGTYTVEAR